MPNLHTPPAILIEAANLLSDDNLDLAALSDLIERDPGLSAKLLDIGNSVSLGQSGGIFSVHHIVLRMGLREVKALVLTTLLRQFYDRQEIEPELLHKVWRRSIQTAVGAQRLAELAAYPNPAEAYLTGLLTKIGQLLLSGQNPAAYRCLLEDMVEGDDLSLAEQARFGTDHCVLGADLVDAWRIDPILAEAIRHHLLPFDRLDSPHPLIKIVNLAAALEPGSDTNEHECLHAHALLKLTGELLNRLKHQISAEVDSLSKLLGSSPEKAASELGLEGPDRPTDPDKLRRCVEELAGVTPFDSDWREIDNIADLENAIRRSVYALQGLQVAMVLYADQQGERLCGHRVYRGRDVFPVHLDISLNDASCRFCLAVRQHRNLVIAEPQSVVEEELLHATHSARLILSPVYANGLNVGLLILVPGADLPLPELDHSLGFKSLKVIVGRMIAQVMALTATATQNAKDQKGIQAKIQEAVHEASNPLSVIATYLELLKFRYQDGTRETQEIAFIQQEIERVGNILLRLRDPQLKHSGGDKTELAGVLKNVTALFQNSLCLTRQVNLNLTLAPELPPVQMDPAAFKQIMINLIKNAIEALKPKQSVTVSVTGTLVSNGRNFCELVVADDGPGIPETVLASIFSPLKTAKDHRPRGLGLSIVKSLLDEAGGQILCRTSSRGSQFQILLPISAS